MDAATWLQTVVDIATLTGAAGVALGQDTGALFSNSDELAAAVSNASKLTGKPFAQQAMSSPARHSVLARTLLEALHHISQARVERSYCSH